MIESKLNIETESMYAYTNEYPSDINFDSTVSTSSTDAFAGGEKSASLCDSDIDA